MVQKINKKDIQYLIIRNGYYYINIPLGNGKLFRKSLKTTDIVEAISYKREIMAGDDWNRRHAAKEMGITISGVYTKASESKEMAKLTNAILQLIEQETTKLKKVTVAQEHLDEEEFKEWKTGNRSQQAEKQTTFGKTIQQAIDEYCEKNIDSGMHKDTKRRYKKLLETTGEWAGGCDKDISVLPGSAAKIFENIKNQDYRAGTINQQINTFIRFANFLNDMELKDNKIPYSSVSKVQKKANDSQTIAFSPEECYKILNSKLLRTQQDMRAFFAVSIYTGSRPIEISNLLTKDVDFERMRLLMPTAKSKNRNIPNPPRYIPIHKDLLNYLKAVSPGKTYFFEKLRKSKSSRKKTSKDTTKYWIDNILKEERVPKYIITEQQNGDEIQEIKQNRTYYSFRHSFMEALARVGTSYDIIGLIAGHKPKTTAGIHYIKDLEAYYNEKREAIDKAVFILPPTS